MLKHIITIAICVAVSISILIFLYLKNSAQEKRIDDLLERYRRLEIILTRPDSKNELLSGLYRNASRRISADDRPSDRPSDSDVTRDRLYKSLYDSRAHKSRIDEDLQDSAIKTPRTSNDPICNRLDADDAVQLKDNE